MEAKPKLNLKNFNFDLSNFHVNFNYIKRVVAKYLLDFMIPLACLVLSLVLGLFVLRPSISKLPELQQTNEEVTALDLQLTEKLKNLNDLLNFKPIISNHVDDFEVILPSEPMVPQLLTQVDTLVAINGLALKDLNYASQVVVTPSGAQPTVAVQTPAALAPSRFVLVNLKVVGTYNQVIPFLRNMETSGRVLKVDSVRLSKFRSGLGDEEVVDDAMSMDFVLRAPYLRVQSNAVTDDPVTIDINDPKFNETRARVEGFEVYKYNIRTLQRELITEGTRESTESTESTGLRE